MGHKTRKAADRTPEEAFGQTGGCRIGRSLHPGPETQSDKPKSDQPDGKANRVVIGLPGKSSAAPCMGGIVRDRSGTLRRATTGKPPLLPPTKNAPISAAIQKMTGSLTASTLVPCSNAQAASYLTYASRSMIHSTSGAGTKRHFLSGPAMTLR